MSNKCPTCSQTGAERSNPQGEARRGEPASRNENKLDSASLHKVGVANLPDWTKPATVGEATLERNRQAPRGGWRQRVGKGKQRNLGDPADGGKVGVVHRPHRRESESNGIGESRPLLSTLSSICGSSSSLAPEPVLRLGVERRVTWAALWGAGFSRPDAPAEASAP
jgi:hypothetical protein